MLYKKNRVATQTSGFTLIELLVVIAIIGLLASIILASLNTAREQGRDARRIADVKEIQLALELYYDSASQYPTTIGTPSSSLIAPTYISVLPTDPSTNTVYNYVGLEGAAPDVGTCGSYHLGVTLEQMNNNVLTQDFDGIPNGGSGQNVDTIPCTGGGTDFNGLAYGASSAGECSGSAGTAQPSGTETCYDVEP